jgi:hypothetical protein
MFFLQGEPIHRSKEIRRAVRMICDKAMCKMSDWQLAGSELFAQASLPIVYEMHSKLKDLQQWSLVDSMIFTGDIQKKNVVNFIAKNNWIETHFI